MSKLYTANSITLFGDIIRQNQHEKSWKSLLLCSFEVEQLKVLSWTASLVLHHDVQTCPLLGIDQRRISGWVKLVLLQQSVNVRGSCLDELFFLVVVEGSTKAEVGAEPAWSAAVDLLPLHVPEDVELEWGLSQFHFSLALESMRLALAFALFPLSFPQLLLSFPFLLMASFLLLLFGSSILLLFDSSLLLFKLFQPFLFHLLLFF